ncbi:MAG TPA: S8 family serine peptidase [Polyangiaceae bacterium]|nr:S8 family serine peptidase [Polyangiaceae bacterium]
MRRSLFAAIVFAASTAAAQAPSGVGLVRVLGPRAASVLAPVSGQVGALVAIPEGHAAVEYGLIPFQPGLGRLRGSPGDVLAFGAAHPELAVEVMPPLHTLLMNAQIWTRAGLARDERGADGSGAAVGIVDTGIDPTLADFHDPTTKKSRIAWLLDLSMKPAGLHPDLEKQYGIKDSSGTLVQGAVFTGDEIDALAAKGGIIPTDPNGHGTHVASIAAGNGGGGPYVGMAPKATLFIARVTRDASGTIENDDTLLGAQFVFAQADALGLPIAANFSLGTDFGPHDGTSFWEQSIAAFAGPSHPGHAVVAAMGNSGSIVDNPIHQSVAITEGGTVRVPIQTFGASSNGAVQIWVTLRPGAEMNIGLDGPDGTWVSPISDGNEAARNTSDYSSGVIFGSGIPNSPIPSASHGAIVLWTGKWPKGVYAVTLQGHGMAELYLTGLGDAQLAGPTPAYFIGAVREATVNLPASSPDIISVGCSVDSPSWKSVGGQTVGITEPLLDPAGGLPLLDAKGNVQRQEVQQGEVCYFSSAGPTLSGVPKPDILAPGAVVAAAMSQQALPGSPTSIFTTDCPPSKSTGKVDPKCMEVDATHAVALGTSMSSPMVTGISALLFQADRTLTQDEVRALLQAGAHRARGLVPYFDQAGPGEVDALGALQAYDELSSPNAALPAVETSWMTLSEDFATADGSTPLTAILELRTSQDAQASLFDASRLVPVALVDGQPLSPQPPIVRGAAPGLFTFLVTLPRGLGASQLTLGALFDGRDVVPRVTVPIAVDAWASSYPPSVWGGCQSTGQSGPPSAFSVAAVLGLVLLRRRGAVRAARPPR